MKKIIKIKTKIKNPFMPLTIMGKLIRIKIKSKNPMVPSTTNIESLQGKMRL